VNALADMPAVIRRTHPGVELPRQNARGSYALGLLAALGLHAAVLFGWPPPRVLVEAAEFGVEAADSSIEVSLISAMPAEEIVAEIPPEPPPVEPPPPDAVAEPPPVPEKPPEMTLPEPEPKPQPPSPPKPKPQKAPQPKPARVARASGDGSSAVPGNDATTARASAGALGAKPGYLRNPHPSYPEEARTAGHQGTVTLYVRVDEQGRVASARVSNSSGYALLDERALSTVASQWIFKPAKVGGLAVASDVIIPIRFTLNH
jgi:protein TonB